MHPAIEQQIPDGHLAASVLLSEKPRHGVTSKNTAPNQGISEANSTAAIGLRAGLLLNRVQSRYTGKERDTESGLDYFGARYYASNMGRWLSPDWSATPDAVPYSSLSNPQSLNLYSYVKNNPLSSVDPDGHNGFTDFFQKLGNVFRYGAFELTTDVINDERQYLVDKGVVTVNGKTGKVLDYSNATNGQIDSAFRSFRNSEILSSIGLAAGAPLLGANGTQTTSKTLWEDGKEHIDVENPNPGQRPGQIHYQDGVNKYIYDVESGQFEGLSNTQSKQLLSKPEVQQAIDKGLKYLGVSR
jgi:RHS repeat-associated protein